MLAVLRPHPATSAPALDIEVDIARRGEAALELRYVVRGDISRVRVPGWVKRTRADELWRTTCFEAFIKADGGGYYEFNLSPSGQWAVYRFDGYREGMQAQPGVELRDARRVHEAERLELVVTLDLDRLRLARTGPWPIGLSTVIEDVDGNISYWALAHAPGKPDFHHPDSFVLELP